MREGIRKEGEQKQKEMDKNIVILANTYSYQTDLEVNTEFWFLPTTWDISGVKNMCPDKAMAKMKRRQTISFSFRLSVIERNREENMSVFANDEGQ
jgi:hypothetical protein